VSALELEIRAAVAAALAEQLPPLIQDAVRSAVAALHLGGAGDDLVDATVAFRLLGYPSAKALRRSAERGSCPVVPEKIGRRVRWRRADLIAFAEKSRRQAAG
jgi:hypothetical protein